METVSVKVGSSFWCGKTKARRLLSSQRLQLYEHKIFHSYFNYKWKNSFILVLCNI